MTCMKTLEKKYNVKLHICIIREFVGLVLNIVHRKEIADVCFVEI